MIDALNLVNPGWGYLALFGLSSLLMFAGTAVLFQARRVARAR